MFFNKYNIKSRNINLIGFSELTVGFIFFLPIMALYMEKELFSITTVALIFAIQQIITVILEIPSGAFADLFGRKRTFVLGHFLVLVALTFFYIGGNITNFIIFSLFAGVSSALMSGTDDAIIYDTLKAEKKEKHYKKITSILSALWPLGAIIGSLAGGYMATISLRLPILLSFIPLSVSFILVLFIKEPKYEKEKHKNVIKQMWESTKFVIEKKQVLLIIIVGMIMLAFGETAHTLKSIFLEFKQIPLVYFGYIFAITFGLSSLGHYISHDVSEKIGDKSTITVAVFTFTLFLLLSALTSGLISMIFLVLTAVSFGLKNPVMKHMINTQIESSKRTTILSINSLSGQVGMAIGGPFLGYMADLYTINTAYIIASVLMIIAVVVTLFLKDKK